MEGGKYMEEDKNVKKLRKYLKTIEESYIKLLNDGAEIPEKERDNLQFKIEINLERAETLTKEIFM
ncbi:hypothetical protein [Clostridium sp. C2-6-12]|uniref:hypothetical protein n=1 Tax=Clostridium sp. C2-6-12 TaxID=2698832 RepID=UPI001A9BB4D2|nr:hypothetical protein [Clostridium sp. C2-6-12]